MEQTFEEYVTEWDDMVAKIDANKALMKPLVAKEMAMRRAIAHRLDEVLDDLKEGVNKFEMADGRTLKYTYKVDRKIEQAEITTAREAYELLNDNPVAFDEVLRIRYELSKRDWDKLEGEALKVVSRMIAAKPAAPTIEII